MIRLSYRQIADDLADRIRNGEYRPGDRLSSRGELAQLYGVSSDTIKRAMLLLAERGIATYIGGRGWYVIQDEASE